MVDETPAAEHALPAGLVLVAKEAASAAPSFVAVQPPEPVPDTCASSWLAAATLCVIAWSCQRLCLSGSRLRLETSRVYSATAARVVTQFLPIFWAESLPCLARRFR